MLQLPLGADSLLDRILRYQTSSADSRLKIPIRFRRECHDSPIKRKKSCQRE